MIRASPDCSGRSWWWPSRSLLSPGFGRTRSITSRYAASPQALPSSVPIDVANLWVIGALVGGLIALYALRRRLIAQQMLDGRSRRLWPYALVLVVGLPLLVSVVSGASWSVTLPELRGFNFVGGWTL